MNHDHGVNGAVSSDLLLAQENWLRGLIGRMVVESDVDDLVQDTWIEAIKQPLTVSGSLRGWLRTVATRLALRSHRTDRRRRNREQLAAAEHVSPPVDDALVWAEIRQRVTAAVMNLREPYRGTLLRRFYDGQSAREIAIRTNTPIATVRIRLQRGMQKLRDDMPSRCGPDWRPALAVFALPSGGATVVPAARRLSLLGAAAVVCISAVTMFANWNEPDPVATDLVASDVTPEPTVLDVTVPTEPAPRESLPVRQHTKPMRRVAGRVLDPRGRPIPGTEIVFRRLIGAPFDTPDGRRVARIETLVLGHADRDGRFDLPCPMGTGGLAAEDRVVALCLWPLGREGRDVHNARIIATRSVRLTGIVVDARHRGIPGVRVAARCEQLPAFPEILDRQLFVIPVAETHTDEHGRFEIADFPLDCPALLHLAKAGYRQISLTPETTERTLRIPLALSTIDDPLRIAGRVFDLHGRVVCAAVVGIARTRTHTDAVGEYRLEIAGVDDNDLLYAGKKGYRTAVERAIAERLRRHRGGTLFVDLTLGPPPRTIAGVITDGRGVPLPDHLVFLADPMFLDGHSFSAEALAAGQTELPHGASDRANAGGRFAIRGLDDRNYQLRVYDPKTANAVDGGSHRAGDENVTVTIPRERFVSRPGRLIDDAGNAIAGAKVYFGCAARRKSVDVMRLRPPIVTDADGRFTLRRVPREGGNVYVIGGSVDDDDPGIVPTIIPLDRNALDVPTLELRVARLCHFRVRAPKAPRKSTIHLLDDYGQRIDILVKHATGCNHYDTWTLEGETTQVLCASQRARTMVLVNPDGMEIARTRIHLSPNYITEIDL